MPRLSDTMEEGTVSAWLKKVGDKVKEGDIIAEIETDKATMEFESFHEGILLHIGVEEGESAPVDEVLAIIGDKKTDIEKALKSIGKKDIIEEKQTKHEIPNKKIFHQKKLIMLKLILLKINLKMNL